MYEIVFDEKVIEFIEKLDYNIKFNIFDNLRVIKKNPLEFARKISGVYVILIENFRIIVDIDKDKKLIKILFIRKTFP